MGSVAGSPGPARRRTRTDRAVGSVGGGSGASGQLEGHGRSRARALRALAGYLSLSPPRHGDHMTRVRATMTVLGHHHCHLGEEREPLRWIIAAVVVTLAVVALGYAAPVFIVGGVVLAALVLLNPRNAGVRIRNWPLWDRLPGLRTAEYSVAAFAGILLLYTVPLPLAAAALVHSGGSSAPAPTTQVARAPSQPEATQTATEPAAPLATTAPTAAPTAAPTLLTTPVPVAPPTPAPTSPPPPPTYTQPPAAPAPSTAPAPSDPYPAATAAGASAVCADGSWSNSQHRSGTCSSHGGVHWWTGNLGPAGPGAH